MGKVCSFNNFWLGFAILNLIRNSKIEGREEVKKKNQQTKTQTVHFHKINTQNQKKLQQINKKAIFKHKPCQSQSVGLHNRQFGAINI